MKEEVNNVPKDPTGYPIFFLQDNKVLIIYTVEKIISHPSDHYFFGTIRNNNNNITVNAYFCWDENKELFFMGDRIIQEVNPLELNSPYIRIEQ